MSAADRPIVPALQPLGAQIRIARMRRHWSQIDLAAAAGISLPTIRHIELGRSAGTYYLHAIAVALGITLRIDPVGPGFRSCGRCGHPEPAHVLTGNCLFTDYVLRGPKAPLQRGCICPQFQEGPT